MSNLAEPASVALIDTGSYQIINNGTVRVVFRSSAENRSGESKPVYALVPPLTAPA